MGSLKNFHQNRAVFRLRPFENLVLIGVFIGVQSSPIATRKIHTKRTGRLEYYIAGHLVYEQPNWHRARTFLPRVLDALEIEIHTQHILDAELSERELKVVGTQTDIGNRLASEFGTQNFQELFVIKAHSRSEERR